jgi:tetratricopeptide (TPR) repeat protein
MLLVSSFVGAPAIAQQDEAAALEKRVGQLYRAGKFSEAMPLARRSLAIREQTLGPDHPDVATSSSWLAQLYKSQGHYAEAEALFRRALAIREKALGRDHPDVAKSLNNLAELHVIQGRYADAEPLLKRALAVSEKARGRDHPEVATELNNLAGLYESQGRYGDAEPLVTRSLAIWERALGPDHPDIATALNNLAALYHAQGRYADAEPLLKRALAIREKALSPDHPDVARSLDNLASFYNNQGRYADAEPLLKRALAIWEKALGRDHPDIATALINLASLYDSQGRYAEAEPLYKRSLAIREKALGPDHPDVGRSLNSLAGLYVRQGRYADALPLVQTTIGHGVALPYVAPQVLFAVQPNGRRRFAVGNGLIPAVWAQDDALNVVQRASQSVAATAVNKFGARLAAGSGRLAGLVRNDQDLAVEAENLDKAILAAVAKEPAKRDAAAEQRIRDRLVEIAKQRATLQGVFAVEFPDYAALSNPQPLTVKEIQALLSDGEALLLYATEEKESYVFAVTRTSAAWTQIPLGTAALSEKVAAFRRGLDVEALRQSAEGGKPVLFDLGWPMISMSRWSDLSMI